MGWVLVVQCMIWRQRLQVRLSFHALPKHVQPCAADHTIAQRCSQIIQVNSRSAADLVASCRG